MMDQEKIGKFIASKRKEKKLTQEELALKLGVTNKAVSKWERGRCLPDLSIIQELCKILGISVSTLLNGEEKKEDVIVIKLLWIISKFKQLKYAFCGLAICYISEVLENIKFKKWFGENTFSSGFYDGVIVGLEIVGVFIFFLGLTMYFQKYYKIKNKK